MKETARKLLAAGVALACLRSFAGDLAVSVTGNDGKPLAHAVVTLGGNAGTHAGTRHATPVVDQAGKQFRPWVVAAKAGEAVAFSNHDDITHHVYSFSPARPFSFRLQSGEEHAPIRFDEPGVIVLGCNIHDWMVGYLHVTDAAFTATTDARGEVLFNDVPAGEWRIRLWHPGLGEAFPAQQVTVRDDDNDTVALHVMQPLDETGPREPLGDGDYALP